MFQPADARLTPDIAQGVCVRTATPPSWRDQRGSLVVSTCSACAPSTVRRRHPRRREAQRHAKKSPEHTSQIATRFRTRVGESLATIEKHSTPLEEATTPSLEALKAYSTGARATGGGWIRRLPLYQRAVAIDPDFAMAHARVGFGYSTMGESALARTSIRKAYELRDRVSDVERFFIETVYP